MKALFLGLAAAGILTAAGLAAPAVLAAEDDAERVARWQELRDSFFDGRPAQDGAGVVSLDAPVRALDAALVPLTVTLASDADVVGLHVIVDDNPGPLAAHVSFGPAGDPSEFKLRVRVDQYTLIHAVAETADGVLHETAKFVKAAGGCSAPVGADAEAALAEIGRMKLRLPGEIAFGQPVEAQLMIRHPNFNGMQMDQLSRMYTPPRYIQSIDVTYDGVLVLHLDGDISLSTDPVLGFRFLPAARGTLKVMVRDSVDTVFEESFDIPAQGS